MQRETLQVWVASEDVHVAVGQAVHEELEVGDCARLLLVIRARDAAGAQVVEVETCSTVRAGFGGAAGSQCASPRTYWRRAARAGVRRRHTRGQPGGVSTSPRSLTSQAERPAAVPDV